MDSNEIQLMLKMSYKEMVDHLLNKYGPVPFDYFNVNQFGGLVSVNNKNARAATDGLFIHHIDEDKAIMLSSIDHAKKKPYEYQSADRLVYCNILEHLLMHFKISMEPKHEDAETEAVGIGGALTYIVWQINDYFTGYQFKKKHMYLVFSTIENNRDDYIMILENFFKHCIDNYNKTFLERLINELTKASGRKFFEEGKQHLIKLLEEQKFSDEKLRSILANAEKGDAYDAINLVRLYNRGVNVEYNKKEIKKWCLRAETVNDGKMLFEIAEIYMSLRDMFEKRLELIKRSAVLGYAKAQTEFGRLYLAFGERSTAGENWREEGLFWLNKAIEQNDNYAKEIYARTFFNKDSSEEEIANCLNYLKEASEQKDIGSIRKLAREYLEGDVIPRDYLQATKYYLMAVDLQDRISEEELKRYHVELLKFFVESREKLTN